MIFSFSCFVIISHLPKDERATYDDNPQVIAYLDIKDPPRRDKLFHKNFLRLLLLLKSLQ